MQVLFARGWFPIFSPDSRPWIDSFICGFLPPLPMKIGILGSGDVGQALGRGFALAKHQVMIGTRSPQDKKLVPWLKQAGKNGSTGLFSQAAAFGEVIVIAVKGEVVESVLKDIGPNAFTGKVVIDVSNALDFSKGMPPSLFVGWNDSLGERVQKVLTESKVVKCWNIVPNALMYKPSLAGTQPTMIICGNDASAKNIVKQFLQEFGWKDIIDIGGIEGSRYLESLVGLWIRVAGALGNYNHAFKVL